MPLPQPWQVTPAPDTLPDYTDYLSALFRPPSPPNPRSTSSTRRRRRIKSALVTGQCSVCLDLFGVSVGLVEVHMVVQEMTPRLKVRRTQQKQKQDPAMGSSFALYHSHPFSQHNLPDGEVKLYGSKDILQDIFLA